MSDRTQNIESELNLFGQTDLLETPNVTIKIVTEKPVDGVAYQESYSSPCIVLNFGAQLSTFEVEGDRGGSYKGSVIPGDFSFLPPGSLLSGYYQGEMLCYAYIILSPERFDSQRAEKMLIMANDPLIQQFAKTLYSHKDRSDPDIALYRESMSEALIQHLQLIHLDTQSSYFKPQPNLDRLENYIRANLDRQLTVSELAKLEKTTSKLLQKAVQKRYQLTVYEWITTLRLERSLLLLRDRNLSLAAIAIETGFANQSHWTRLFRRQFGITPGKLRSQWT